MAFNIKQMKATMSSGGGMAYSSVPPGWMYDAMTDSYVNNQGLKVSRFDRDKFGGIEAAILAIHGPQALQMATGHISQAAISNGTWASSPVGITKVDTKDVISIDTKVGRVGINMETGDITVPPGIGRDEAIREFWFGFQKVFEPSGKAQYEKKIKDLQQQVEIEKVRVDMAYKVSTKESATHIADKIRKKYGNEKFIMVKPEDLIKFIEEG